MALGNKHIRCLELLKQNKHSVPTIATMVGFSKEHLYDLINGNPPTSSMAQQFQAEYNKITKIIEDRTFHKMTKTRELIVNKLLTWVDSMKTTSVQSMSKQKHKQLVDALNALTKALPSVSVESTYEWTGLKGDDLVNEFHRITALARSIVERKRIPGPANGGTGQIPERGQPDDPLGQGLQDPQV